MNKVDELTEMINSLNIEPVLKSQARRVKWLFNNSNKTTMVYDEKLVRLIIHKLKEKIIELEESNEFIKEKSEDYKCDYEILKQCVTEIKSISNCPKTLDIISNAEIHLCANMK